MYRIGRSNTEGISGLIFMSFNSHCSWFTVMNGSEPLNCCSEDYHLKVREEIHSVIRIILF